MTTRPTKVPEWATDTVYDEPGEAWDGTATKVEPTTVRQAEGWTPAARPPATHFNWWQNATAAWILFLANIQIANWRLVEATDNANAEVWGSTDAVFRCGVRVPEAAGGWGQAIVFGDVDSVSTNAMAATCTQVATRSWGVETVDTTSPAASIFGCCHDTTNDLVLCCGTGGLIYSRPQTGSTTWTQRNAVAGVDLRDMVHGSGTGTPVLVAVGEDTATDDARIYSSVDGVTWTLRFSSADRPLYGVANKPGAMWIAVGDNLITAKIWRSSDGENWFESTTATTGLLRHVVYDTRSGLFCAIGLAGARCTSSDGITWTDRTDTGEAWLDGDPAGMAVDGNGSILVLSEGGAGGQMKAYLSTDGGITWTAGYSVQVDGQVFCTSARPFWAGEWGWVIPGEVGVIGTPKAAVYASLRL